MDIKKYIQEEVEKLHKRTLLENKKARIEKQLKLLKEDGPFNDDGEPLMTHQQYNDYSEPSEEDFEDRDNYDEDEDYDRIKYLSKELKKNDIFLETYDDQEYFIRCKGKMYFEFYTQGNSFITDVYASDVNYSEENSSKKEFDSEDQIEELKNYILSFKEMFLSFGESVKARNKEMQPDPEDKYRGYI